MRFLVDEMFGADVAVRLRTSGHDALHVTELRLGAAEDRDILEYAAADARIVVTENASDFVPLLDARLAVGLPLTPVVIALKRRLPTEGGALSNALAHQLSLWAENHPNPYPHAHWLS